MTKLSLILLLPTLIINFNYSKYQIFFLIHFNNDSFRNNMTRIVEIFMLNENNTKHNNYF